MTLSQTSESDEEGILPPLSPRDPKGLEERGEENGEEYQFSF